MAKKEDEKMTGRRDDDEPEEAEAASERVSTTPGAPAPRAARFGEGREGRAVRRERGVAGPRAGFFERTRQFLHDTRVELRRVSWPSTTEVRNTTIITIVAVIFFAVYLYGVDYGFTKLVELLNWLV